MSPTTRGTPAGTLPPGARRRRGVTLVEVMVAAFLMVILLGALWSFFGVARRQNEQVMRYATILQTAASITARLQIDLASAHVPEGISEGSTLFKIGADGRSLGFTRTPPSDDVLAASTSGSGRRWVEWTTEPGPGGTYRLVRDFSGHRRTVWEGAPAREVRFSLETDASSGLPRVYVVCELLLVDEATAERPDLSARRPIPIRIVQRLRSPGGKGSLEALAEIGQDNDVNFELDNFPHHIFPVLPAFERDAVPLQPPQDLNPELSL